MEWKWRPIKTLLPLTQQFCTILHKSSIWLRNLGCSTPEPILGSHSSEIVGSPQSIAILHWGGFPTSFQYLIPRHILVDNCKYKHSLIKLAEHKGLSILLQAQCWQNGRTVANGICTFICDDVFTWGARWCWYLMLQVIFWYFDIWYVCCSWYMIYVAGDIWYMMQVHHRTGLC